jgi:hypothetical protein
MGSTDVTQMVDTVGLSLFRKLGLINYVSGHNVSGRRC